jgi:ATP-dependent Clp protease, protease subunit
MNLHKLLARNKAKGLFKVEAAADTDEATVYLYDMIVDTAEEAEWWGGVSAEGFVQALASIKAATIHLRVNSPGGSVFGGRAMEQAIRAHTATVVAHVDGLAASAASFLIMAADEIRMAPGSFLMIHNAWSFAMGNAADMRKSADLLEQIDASLVKTYAKRSGQDPADIAAMMAAETWLEADAAVERGFATLVDDQPAPKAIAWDLSAFKNTPKTSQNEPKQAEKPPEPTYPQPDRQALHRAVLRAAIPPA